MDCGAVDALPVSIHAHAIAWPDFDHQGESLIFQQNFP